MFGVGLGAAILIDVLVVRMVVSPALVTLLGDRAWWMPRLAGPHPPNVVARGRGEGAEVEPEREKVFA